MLTRRTVIESLGVYLPPRRVASKAIVEGCRHNIRFALDLATGIQERRMAGETEFAIDLARKAVENCLERSRHSLNDIDLLLCTNIARCDAADQYWTMEPSTASRLCRDLGLTSTLAFDISNACAGMFTGIYLADALLQSGCIDRALVVSGEYITLLTETAQKEVSSLRDPRLACLTLGDAGAAVLLERTEDEKAGFLGLDLYTLGGFSSLCTAAPTGEPHGGVIMNTDMANLAELCQRHGTSHAISMLERCGLRKEAIDWAIPHQTSKWTLSSVGGSLATEYPADRIVNNLAVRGNTASTTHFVALNDQIHSGRIQSGQTLMFSINASGATIGTALYRLDDLPDRLRSRKPRPHRPVCRSFPLNGFLSGDGPPEVALESVGTAFPRPGESSKGELLNRAVQTCLQASSHNAREIDLVIHAGVYREDFVMEPAVAAQVAGAAGINPEPDTMTANRSFAFDVFNGAVGFLNACLLGIELISAQRCLRVLVCAAEYENAGPKYAPSTRGVRESAAAVILTASRREGTGFGPFLNRLYTGHCDSLTVRISTRTGPPYQLECQRDPTLEQITLACVIESTEEFLATIGRELREFHWVLPPLVSESFLAEFCSALQLPRERVIGQADGCGDLLTTSFPVSWQQLLQDERYQEGQECLIISAGSGLQVCCATYRC